MEELESPNRGIKLYGSARIVGVFRILMKANIKNVKTVIRDVTSTRLSFRGIEWKTEDT